MDTKCNKCRCEKLEDKYAACSECREKQRYYMQRRREVQKGICQRCWKEKVDEGCVYCKPCLAAQKENRKRLIEEGKCIYCKQERQTSAGLCDACRDRSNANHRNRSRLFKEMGLCTKCGKQEPVKGKTKCKECRDMSHYAYRRRVEEHKQGNGTECIRCGKPSKTKSCEMCYLKFISSKSLGKASLWQDIKRIFDEQNGVCPYTGYNLALGENADLDHIIPRAKGGSNDLDNLQWVYSPANQMKWDRSEEEFFDLVKTIYEHKHLGVKLET